MTTLIAVLVMVAVGVVTDLVTGWARATLRSAVGFIRRRVFPRSAVPEDHATIHSGWIRVDGGRWPSVHVHVRCAPSVRWPETRRMNRDGVYRFAHRVAPGVFPHEADYAVPDELIRFMSTPVADTEADRAVACSSPTGAIELSVPIEHRDTPQGPVIAATAIAEVIHAFQGEVASGAFERIFGTSPARVDWLLNLSPSISLGNSQQSEWVDLDFPGRRPSGRAMGMRPPADPRGYGRRVSQSLSITAPADEVERALLTDFLERNGFREITGAIDDIIDAMRSSPTQQHAAS